MLEIINPQLLFGAAGFVGAGIRGLIGFYQAKKEDKKLKFDVAVFIDTAIKGIAAGVAFSVGLPVCLASALVTVLAGAGIDTYANKFGIKIVPLLRDLVSKKKK